MGRFQKRHSVLKAEVLSSLHDRVSSMRSVPQDVQRFRSSYLTHPVQAHLMQDAMECEAALNQSCIAGVATLTMGFTAPNATAAVAYAEEFCTSCEYPETQFQTAVTACGELGGELLAGRDLLLDLVEAACQNPACAGNIMWGLSDMTARRDTFCPNLECGLPVFGAITNLTSGGVLTPNETACTADFMELLCLTDETNTTIYCADFLTDGDNGNDNGSPLSVNTSVFCETTCPGYLTLKLQDITEGNCVDDDPMGGMEDEECDVEGYEPFTLNDFCTQNADGAFCGDLFMSMMEPNVSECPEDLFVPTPSMEELVAPTNCSADCTAQLQATADARGCCIGTMLTAGCTDPITTTFISTTCGVAYETCARPALPDPNPEPTADVGSEETDNPASMTGVSAAVTSILAITALVVLV